MEERGIGENGGRRVGRKKGCLIRYICMNGDR